MGDKERVSVLCIIISGLINSKISHARLVTTECTFLKKGSDLVKSKSMVVTWGGGVWQKQLGQLQVKGGSRKEGH